MGFPTVAMAMKMSKCINITRILLNLLGYFKLIITHLGLFKHPQQPQSSSSDQDPTNYVFVMDGVCPSLVPVPVHILTALIKKKVPVVEFRDFLGRFGGDIDQDGDINAVCTVCLECVEKGDEIRQLYNCCHVFHRECLDCWVDEGQVTCPLCRSMLFPGKGERIRWEEMRSMDDADECNTQLQASST